MIKNMSKNDKKLIGVLLGAAAAAGVLLAVSGVFAERGTSVTITVDGELFGSYPLDEDRVVSIGDSNRCKIEDGRVSMEWADCPDQICVEHMPLDRAGETIVCLPNRVVVEIQGKAAGEQEPDTLVSWESGRGAYGKNRSVCG